jgi:hypothetical protein
MVPSTAPQPSETHAGYELYYDPAVSGWQFRSPDAEPSRESYRSAFLARKAIDALGDEPSSGRASRRRS